MLDKKETLPHRIKRWYTEGLTGEITPDYKKFSERMKTDVERLRHHLTTDRASSQDES